MTDILSVVVPTRNEEENIASLLGDLRRALFGIPHEIVVVDDSSDKTATIAGEIADQVVFGKGQGLGQAILLGIKSSNGSLVAVMDADHSHNPFILPTFYSALSMEGYDMVIGSRYVPRGACVEWSLPRRIISRTASLLAWPITGLKDNTSGFFAFRREILDGIKLDGKSWKVAFEIVCQATPARILETPIEFWPRYKGGSKLSAGQFLAYLLHVGRGAASRYRRFVRFCIIGGTGAAITFGLTALFTEVFGLWYILSLIFAVAVATVWNFTWNALWTFAPKGDVSAEDYEWKSFFQGSVVQRWWKGRVASIVWHFVPTSSALLDIGCGSSPIVSRYPYATVVDRNADKIAFLKGKIPSLTARVMEADTLLFNDNQFDYVLCLEVLEHVPNPEKVVSEISRVLKPGGKAVIATPDYSRFWWKFAEQFTAYSEEHIYQFSRKSLESLARHHGLSPIKYEYVAGCDLVELFGKRS